MFGKIGGRGEGRGEGERRGARRVEISAFRMRSAKLISWQSCQLFPFFHNIQLYSFRKYLVKLAEESKREG
jgi:hypothetical protein